MREERRSIGSNCREEVFDGHATSSDFTASWYGGTGYLPNCWPVYFRLPEELQDGKRQSSSPTIYQPDRGTSGNVFGVPSPCAPISAWGCIRRICPCAKFASAASDALPDWVSVRGKAARLSARFCGNAL